jgi:hypothetical protein
MKHMTAEPDLSGVEEPFATCIRRATAKDVGERFASVKEMVECNVSLSEHLELKSVIESIGVKPNQTKSYILPLRLFTHLMMS